MVDLAGWVASLDAVVELISGRFGRVEPRRRVGAYLRGLLVTNARTEGFNRIIKQTKRVGCGFTNMDNYRRRIMVHIALTRGQRPAA